ncbi:MAG: hypothetical protein B7Y26_09250 [Hydrogenophilales bacterium 16-64-46]|nr:MAG: hypothetical protein B7Z32_12230 [Hydrogenophilales bacterium 12-64-13]OYZ05144.1 MAG: hypothetical protein B7Y26_09250 [Hydrogenophilales bacterium 16-64-46]OZA37962.1 MAG: hypothetical protein B7X87_09180 [Hydrogenophilales bacterium 17-64-34]HQT00506.1 metal-dependent hydrolase [Thiobacillus sp.]
MSSTLGHALCGVTILAAAGSLSHGPFTRFDLRQVLLFAGLANLPDIDMLFSYLLTGHVLSYHGGVTHSLAFALLVALGVASRVQSGRRSVFLLAGLVVASHSLIDSFTGAQLGWHPTRGMPLLWPFSDERFAMPVTLFPGPRHDTLNRLLDIHNLKVMAYELLFFSPFLAGLVWMRGIALCTGRAGRVCSIVRWMERPRIK